MKEWKSVKKGTYAILVVALLILIISFVITAYGGMIGEGILRTV